MTANPRLGVLHRAAKRIRGSAFLILLVSSPPLSAQQPGVTLPAELARVLTDYEKAWSARDPAALARLFAEDGWVLANGSLPVRGRAAIEQHYKGQGGPLALRALAFVTNGDVGYILGGYAATRGAEDDGKFTLTLKKAGGRWLIFSDMDNPNRKRR
jgi:ketosteroid isomerase-like protein